MSALHTAHCTLQVKGTEAMTWVVKVQESKDEPRELEFTIKVRSAVLQDSTLYTQHYTQHCTFNTVHSTLYTVQFHSSGPDPHQEDPSVSGAGRVGSQRQEWGSATGIGLLTAPLSLQLLSTYAPFLCFIRLLYTPHFAPCSPVFPFHAFCFTVLLTAPCS